MFIFKLDRYLIEQNIKKFAHYISGDVLDLGAGNYDRYGAFYQYKTLMKMDVEKSDNVDVVGIAEEIPFPAERFDSVVSTQVFEHISNPEKAAQEIYRVLKRGGTLILTVPQTNELHSEPYDYWRYTKFGLTELFERQGFTKLEMEQSGGFFTVVGHVSMRYLIDRLHLHRRLFIGAILSQVFRIAGMIALFLDRLDRSVANRKHTLGWCAVFRK